jgi:hypothetical protein
LIAGRGETYDRPLMADSRSLDPALASVCGELLGRREELADRLVGEIHARVPEFAEFGGPELWEAVRDSCMANLETGLEALAGDRSVPDRAPLEARELALITARLGLPLGGLLRTYRIGHAAVWSEMFDLLEAEAVDAPARRAAIAAASTYLFEHVDRVSTMLTEEYTAERDRFLRSREQRRTQLVRDVLEGADPDPAVATAVLDYDLRLHHLALVVSAPDPEAAVRCLARELDAPHRLVVVVAGDTAWGWLGRTREFSLPERLPALADAKVSFGEPAQDAAGFRTSHRQARDAHAVALRSGAQEQPVRYADVALESLAAGDRDRAAVFVARELRGIDGDDTRSRRLRETLSAYFAAGQNASSAAAMLGVHEHTVANRLRTIEEALGRPVNSRRAELETALRLFELG